VEINPIVISARAIENGVILDSGAQFTVYRVRVEGSGVIPASLGKSWHLVLHVPESQGVPLRDYRAINREIREDGFRSIVS
jgi:hypothetical protein